MIKLAEIIRLPEPSTLLRLCQQAGVKYVVGRLPRVPASAGSLVYPWDYLPLLNMKDAYEAAGLQLLVIEDSPPLDQARRGLEGRDEEIAAVCTLIENMGRLGIPIWCYNWMADFNWLRTSTATPGRGGSLVSGFDLSQLSDAPATPLGPVSEEALWDSLEYFLARVLPVSERSGVRLAMHPDDPPVSPIRGVARIMRSTENFQRLLDLNPSEANGMTLCQGNFTLMTDDLPAAIRHFGRHGRIFYVHFRDVVGTAERFIETWHDEGMTDLVACMEAYRDVGFDGPMRPDHVPTVEGDTNEDPGYSAYGRLFAIGYIRGLQDAIYCQESAPAAVSDATR
ncbi:MAG: mannonate dehydratase [Acidimicrobiales bacterium]